MKKLKRSFRHYIYSVLTYIQSRCYQMASYLLRLRGLARVESGAGFCMRPISGLLRRARNGPGLASRIRRSNWVYLQGIAIDLDADFVDVSRERYESAATSRGVGVSDSWVSSSVHSRDSDAGWSCFS